MRDDQGNSENNCPKRSLRTLLGDVLKNVGRRGIRKKLLSAFIEIACLRPTSPAQQNCCVALLAVPNKVLDIPERRVFPEALVRQIARRG